MRAQRKLVPEWGVELDGVWFPAGLLEELSEQGRYDSQFGGAFTAASRDQERVLLTRGLAEKETRGGLHAGPGMKNFWGELEFPDPAPDRPMTRTERIQVRHLLQVLSEHALSVRNAMDPVSGMHTIRLSAWRAQYDSLTAQLKSFTDRLA
jgi:hypothetical protein